ncbi:hypothetical protein T10_1036 [Trichinella papuae]|uniref:Uncharacterized protein n=1 Tax=Trichinella papuae TaxID=268474 RepID=A0A0V1N969_9BILA|nr:hypothetical protein T10_1036 [Trichinella papuae]
MATVPTLVGAHLPVTICIPDVLLPIVRAVANGENGKERLSTSVNSANQPKLTFIMLYIVSVSCQWKLIKKSVPVNYESIPCSALCFVLITIHNVYGSALGNAFLGAGFVAYNTRIEVIELTNKTIDQKLCLLRAPDITLFQLGDTLLAVSVFSLAVERCIAVSTLTLDQLFKKKTSYFLIRFTILATLLDCAIFWILVLSTSRPKVHYCIHMEIASETLFVMHFIFINVLGYSSLILCIITALLLKKKKSICCNVRQMQLKREMRVMKRIVVTLAFTFCFQNLPATLHLIVVYNPDLEFLNSQYLWIAQNISASAHAAMHILMTISIRNIFSRIFFHFSICSPFKLNSIHAANNKIIIVHSTCGKSEKTFCDLEKSKQKTRM